MSRDRSRVASIPATSPKVLANRRNALASTGPKTAEGKAISARNATRHGILARLEVLPGERPKDWHVHLAAVLQDLGATGHLETALAERVALQLWKLGRVARYEREVVASSLDTVEADFTNATEDKIRTAQATRDLVAALPELPDEEPVDSELAASLVELVASVLKVDLYADMSFPGFPDYPDGVALKAMNWDADHLRRCLAAVTDHVGRELEEVLAGCLLASEAHLADVGAWRGAARSSVRRLLRLGALPNEQVLDKVARYETHLERSMFRTLRELQRLQATHTGGYIEAVAVDVTIDEGPAR